MNKKEKFPELSANNSGIPCRVPSTNITIDNISIHQSRAEINKNNKTFSKFKQETLKILDEAYANGKVAFQMAIDGLKAQYISNEEYFDAIDEVAASIIKSKQKEIDRLEASQSSQFYYEGMAYDIPAYYKMDKNTGIFQYDSKWGGYQNIFTKPAFVQAIMKDIDNEKIYYKLIFLDVLNHWHSEIVPARTLSDRNALLELSNIGFPVTSESAKQMVTFLNKFIACNPFAIQHIQSASRLGWYGENFIPFDPTIELQANDSVFKAVLTTKGSIEDWKQIMIPCRHKSPVFRALLDASVASVLLPLVAGLPFVLHIYGGTGCGKSVALNAAMSIWGDTDVIVRSLNATNNALLHYAAVMKNFPVALDELETRQANENTDQLLYQITEGQSRGRCAKDGTARFTETWKNITLTTGEHEITADSRRGGALNRAFEIPCTENLFDSFSDVIACTKSNYGHIGREFIAGLQDIMKNGIDGMTWDDFLHFYLKEFQQHAQKSVEGKQAGAAAVLLMGDMLFSMIVERISLPNAVTSTAQFEPTLLSWGKCDVSGDIARRAYQVLVDYTSQYRSRFQIGTNKVPDCVGRIDDDSFAILPTVAETQLKQAAFQPADALEKMKQAGILIPDAQGKTKTSLRINGKNQRVYRIKFID